MLINIDDQLLETARKHLPWYFRNQPDEAALAKIIEFSLFRYCAPGYQTDPLGNAKSCYMYEKRFAEKPFEKGEKFVVFHILNMRQLNEEIGIEKGDGKISEVAAALAKVVKGDMYRLASGDKYLTFSTEYNESELDPPLPLEIIQMKVLKTTDWEDRFFTQPLTTMGFILNAIKFGKNEYFEVIERHTIDKAKR